MNQEKLGKFDRILTDIRYSIISSFFTGEKCLELGCGVGLMSKKLRKKFKFLVINDIDATAMNINKYGNISLLGPIRNIKLKDKFDTIVCCNVIEHISPKELKETFNKIKQKARKNSKIIFTVPNSMSINRVVGVDISLLKTNESLSDGDREVGHKKMYNLFTFLDLLKKHGFKVKTYGTYLYKPFTNTLMGKIPKWLLKEIYNIPMKNLGAEIIVVCEK